MIRGLEGVLLGSENAQKLADFYKDVVGLTRTSEFEMGEGAKGFSFEMSGSSGVYILDHSEVKGENQNPERHILNFEVDDIEKEVARLKGKDVKLIKDIYHVEGYGLIATFQDPDGNYFQFVQIRPSDVNGAAS